MKILKGFRSRDGVSVMSSGIAVRFISMVVLMILTRMMSKDEYGHIVYALAIINMLSAFSGAGMDRALLRFGAIAHNDKEKNLYYFYALKHGLAVSAGLSISILAFGQVMTVNVPGARPYLYILALLIITEYIYHIIQSNARIHLKNKLYAQQGFVRALSLLIFSVPMVYLFNASGYAWALVLTPIIALILFPYSNVGFAELFSINKSKDSIDQKEYYKFGLMVGIGAVINRLQTIIDSIFIGNMLPDPADIAVFRVGAIIPSRLLFIPQIYFKTEYVHLSSHWADKAIIKNFIKVYLSSSSIFFFFLNLITMLFAEPIMTVLFGAKYSDAGPILTILIIGITSRIVLRQPFGNLLTMSGKAQIGTIVGIIAIIIDINLLLVLIPKYGIIGAASATAMTGWFQGITVTICYYFAVYRRL